MTDQILKLINREFTCMGGPYCENDGRSLVHSRGCPAAFRMRAVDLVKRVLLEVTKQIDKGRHDGRSGNGDRGTRGREGGDRGGHRDSTA